jgi:hypothetical protein
MSEAAPRLNVGRGLHGLARADQPNICEKAVRFTRRQDRRVGSIRPEPSPLLFRRLSVSEKVPPTAPDRGGTGGRYINEGKRQKQVPSLCLGMTTFEAARKDGEMNSPLQRQ